MGNSLCREAVNRTKNFVFRSHTSTVIKICTIVALLLIGLPHAASAQITQVANPEFSVERGFYSATFQVTLSSPTTGASIRYTTDGSTPTDVTGTLYSGPITITETTPLRAVAYKSGFNNSDLVTHSYLFLADIIQQSNSPAGFPAEFSDNYDGKGPYIADYEMDPDVINDGAYSNIMDDALLALPTLSIATDIDNLFSETDGIYYYPLDRGEAWERPNSVEMINPDGTTEFAYNTGMRIHGNASRRPHKTPKKSFRLYFRSDYGPSKLNLDLFGDPAASTEFDKLVLRAFYNNSWAHWDGLQRQQALYVRDEFARRSQRAMGHISPFGTHSHLYINGVYWGIYNIVERVDDNYLADYFGGDAGDWDMIAAATGNTYEAAEGNVVVWDQLISLIEDGVSTDAEYQAVLEYLDLESFIDYMILMHYAGNIDWPVRNWYAVRKDRPGEGFKFIAWDSERTLEGENLNILNATFSDTPGAIFQELRHFDEFQMAYADRIYKHMFNDGALIPSKSLARFNELTSLMEQPVVAESARWGDYVRDVYRNPDSASGPYELQTRDDYWYAERDEVVNNYLPVRTGNVVDQYRDKSLYPSIEPPTFGQKGGAIAAGFSLAISNAINSNSGTIYYTLDGSDPRSYGGAISGSASNGNDLVNVVLTSGTHVKARVLDGNEWSALHEAVFYMVQDYSGLVINEIMYKPVDAAAPSEELEFLELVNAGATTLDLTGVTFAAGFMYTFPAGTMLAPGEYYVLASSAVDFEVQYGFAPDGDYLGSLRNNGENVEIHDANGGYIDNVHYLPIPDWPTNPDGFGSSLELTSTAFDNALPTSWQAAGVAGGTPGQPNSGGGGVDLCDPQPTGLVINEINYNSSDTFDPGDWVEIYNPTATAVDLDGWFFQDQGHSFVLPDVELLPDAYIVLVDNTALFTGLYPSVSNYLGDLGFGFSGGGERLRLVAPSGCIVDEVDYDDVAPWPTGPDGNGSTLSLLGSNLDNSLPASWQESTGEGGTPGWENWLPLATTMNAVSAESTTATITPILITTLFAAVSLGFVTFSLRRKRA